MKQELQEKLNLFAINSQIIKNDFKWQDILTKKLAALLYALDNKPIDSEFIRESHNLIKSNTGIFSTFRGNMSMCVAAMLSLKENREELFEQTLSVYEMMMKIKFRTSDYLVVAAYEIASAAKPEDYPRTVARARAFYDGMKAKGYFRTGQDDYIFAAMLGLSDIDIITGTDRIKQLYRQLKPEFRSGNSVQALAQILVLGGESNASAERVLLLNEELKNKKIQLDKEHTLPSLGVLALLPANVQTIVNDIEEAQAFLKTQKGFGSLSATKQELLLFSAAMVASAYMGEAADDLPGSPVKASVTTSIASILIAHQAVMTAVILASTTAAAASSS